MRAFLIGLVPTFILMATLSFLAGVLYWHKSRRRGYRSPLTRQLMRGPGQSLAIRIEDLSLDIESRAICLVTIPLVFYSSYVSMNYYGVAKQGSHTGIIYILATIGTIIFLAIKLRALLNERHSARLGLDCEIAVGQELNGLMYEGYRVYHDVPAENFNIDHVAVGPNGVFAVETKGRAKPKRGQGKADATVVYDGCNLTFPDWVDGSFLDQARRQAAWLSKWLSSAVAEQITVHPVLALPGWFIERKLRGDVVLLNGKDYRFLVTQRTGTALSEGLVQRISHQLEHLCRDVEPRAYPASRALALKWKRKAA